MKYRYKTAVILGVLMLLLPWNAFTQDRVNYYPVQFIQYFKSWAIINPAFAGGKSNTELHLQGQRVIGYTAKIGTYAFNANFRLGRKPDIRKPYSSLGVTLYNDQEGRYLNRTRMNVIYAWNTRTGKHTRISGGLQLGGVNYSVKGTPLSGDGSDLTPDASAGVHIFYKEIHGGISVHHLFHGELQPLDEKTFLAPYMNVLGEARLKPIEKIHLTASFCLMQLLSPAEREENSTRIDANLLLGYGSIVEVGIGVFQNNRMSFTAGLTNIFPSLGLLDVHFSYAFTFYQRKNINLPAAEIGVAYQIK